MRVPMIANKEMSYGTRRLKADEGFEANDRAQARLLTALGNARLAEAEPVKKAPAKAKGDDVAALRAEYTQKLGKRPFGGWNADTLREKIAAA